MKFPLFFKKSNYSIKKYLNFLNLREKLIRSTTKMKRSYQGKKVYLFGLNNI